MTHLGAVMAAMAVGLLPPMLLSPPLEIIIDPTRGPVHRNRSERRKKQARAKKLARRGRAK